MRSVTDRNEGGGASLLSGTAAQLCQCPPSPNTTPWRATPDWIQGSLPRRQRGLGAWGCGVPAHGTQHMAGSGVLVLGHCWGILWHFKSLSVSEGGLRAVCVWNRRFLMLHVQTKKTTRCGRVDNVPVLGCDSPCLPPHRGVELALPHPPPPGSGVRKGT